MKGLKGKTVVVTGASSGIGEALARECAVQGANVVLGARSLQKLQLIVGDIRSKGGEAIYCAVDVTKPDGEKVAILSMADGTPFDMDKMYKVAVNSYRGNGGGELLTKGSGISQDELKERIIHSTDKDLRYYLMQYIERKKVIEPRALNQWKFIPEEWVAPASMRDYEFLFGKVKE